MYTGANLTDHHGPLVPLTSIMLRAGAVTSRREAVRLIKQGAVRLAWERNGRWDEGEPYSDQFTKIEVFETDTQYCIRVGKRRFCNLAVV